MTLKEYCQAHSIGVREFARIFSVDPGQASRWISGQRRPRPAQMEEIFRWSGGAVTPNDYYEWAA